MKDSIFTSDAQKFEDHKYRAIIYKAHASEELYMTLCGVENCLPDYYFHAGDRTGYHMHVILQGKGVLSVNGKERPVRFGQMFITKPGEETWYKADSDDPWVYCWMTFDGKFAKDIVEKAGFFSGINIRECHASQQDFYALVLKALEQTELTPSNVYRRTACLLEFISLAIDSCSESDKDIRVKHEYPTDTYVEYAADFIRANYATVKISDVARYIGIHRSYMTGIFKKKMGVSPQEYLMQCRIRLACKLLEETENPIQEIARQVGYDNPLTFSKTFKSYFGVSPRAYRQSKQADEKGEGI
jgi:AraC family transcriptional regulator of arabinose operon